MGDTGLIHKHELSLQHIGGISVELYTSDLPPRRISGMPPEVLHHIFSPNTDMQGTCRTSINHCFATHRRIAWRALSSAATPSDMCCQCGQPTRFSNASRESGACCGTAIAQQRQITSPRHRLPQVAKSLMWIMLAHRLDGIV